jgi:hypothetical protein
MAVGQGVETPYDKVKRYRLEKLFVYVITFVAGIILSLGLWKTTLPVIMPDSVRVTLWGKQYPAKLIIKQYNSIKNKLLARKDLPPQYKIGLLEELDQLKEKLDSYYPYPSLKNLSDPNKYPQMRGRAWIFFIINLLIYIGLVYLFIRYDKIKLRNFFYRLPIVEPPLKLGTPHDFIAWEYLGIDRNYL